jgi:2-oxoglutarate ferredoxin oxidoreductase subunit alpha
MEDKYKFSDDISVVLGGEAGQGLQTIERVMSSVLNQEGYRVFSFSEYMSRVRGGSNSTQIRVTNQRCEAFVERMDIFFPLHRTSLEHCKWRMKDETVIFGDKEYLADTVEGYEVIDVPFMKAAEESGGKIFLNTVVAGFILALFGMM